MVYLRRSVTNLGYSWGYVDIQSSVLRLFFNILCINV